METTLKRSAGMRDFAIVWFGQLVSMLGTGMTNFALALRAWEITGSATSLSLLMLSAIGPGILLGPIAGVVIDRWSRKLVIMLADLGAALYTAVILLLYASDNLQIWHMYVANLLAGVFHAFQRPAFSASITMIRDPLI